MAQDKTTATGGGGTLLPWSAFYVDEADSFPIDPCVGYSRDWAVGYWTGDEPDPLHTIQIGSDARAEGMARRIAKRLNAIWAETAPCALAASSPPSSDGVGVAAEPVAEVLWYDPAAHFGEKKPHKIIDGSLAFMDRAPLGTKLYEHPPGAAGPVAGERFNHAAEDLARIRAAVPTSLLYEVDLVEAVASTFREYVKVAAEATALRKQVAEMAGLRDCSIHSVSDGDQGRHRIQIGCPNLATMQDIREALDRCRKGTLAAPSAPTAGAAVAGVAGDLDGVGAVRGWLIERCVAVERDRDAHLEGTDAARFYDAQLIAYENALGFVTRLLPAASRTEVGREEIGAPGSDPGAQGEADDGVSEGVVVQVIAAYREARRKYGATSQEASVARCCLYDLEELCRRLVATPAAPRSADLPGRDAVAKAIADELGYFHDFDELLNAADAILKLLAPRGAGAETRADGGGDHA